MVVTGLQV